MQNDYVDISFTVLDRVRQGRRLLRDLKTGQIYYDPPEPDAAAEGLPVPEPKVDLIGIREAELDEAFKPLGAKVDAEVLQAGPVVKAVTKRVKAQAKRLLHG